MWEIFLSFLEYFPSNKNLWTLFPILFFITRKYSTHLQGEQEKKEEEAVAENKNKKKNPKTKQKQIEGKKVWEVGLMKAFCGAPMAPRYAPPHTHRQADTHTHT